MSAQAELHAGLPEPPAATFRGIPVAVLGCALVRWAQRSWSAIGLIAVDEVRENVTGYLFAASTLAMAVVLYFEYASLSILETCLCVVPGHVAWFGSSRCSSSRAPRLRLPHDADCSRRAAQDLRRLISTPAAILVTVLFLARCSHLRRWFHARAR